MSAYRIAAADAARVVALLEDLDSPDGTTVVAVTEGSHVEFPYMRVDDPDVVRALQRHLRSQPPRPGSTGGDR